MARVELTSPGELDLSVVLPVYNEEESLAVLWPELLAVLESLGLRFEVIFVDDGSSDRSAGIIRGFHEADARVRLLRFKANAGQTAATDAGFKAARGRRVVVMGADLQNDPQDIPKVLQHLDRGHAATGRRATLDQGNGLARRICSRIATWLRNKLSHESIQDSECTVLALRRECLDDLVLYRGFHRFIPTLLRMRGYRVIEIPVNHRPHRFGRSKCGVLNRLVVDFGDVLVVRWMKDRLLRYEVAEDLGADVAPSGKRVPRV